MSILKKDLMLIMVQKKAKRQNRKSILEQHQVNFQKYVPRKISSVPGKEILKVAQWVPTHAVAK